MYITISYAGKSEPSAEKIAGAMADAGDVVHLSRSSRQPVDINWGRYRANAQLNPDIANTTNKRLMRQLFAEHGVPMPKLLGDWPFAVSDLDDWPYPVVGRPDRHTKGRGFWLCQTIADVEKAVRGTRKKQAASHFMEYIEADREYRVHIFQGKSIRISEKGFTDSSKKEYITRKPDRPVRPVREAAKQAVAAVGLDFGTVDILAKGDRNQEAYVLEVNAAPGLGGSMPRLWAETFKKWKEGQANEM